MSDSDLSAVPDLPADAVIEQSLDRVARELSKKDSNASVNSVRTRVETALGLEYGFLRHTAAWKDRSRDIIQSAVNEEDASASEKPAKAAPKPKAKPAAKNAKKRKSDDDASERNDSEKRAKKLEDQHESSPLGLNGEKEEAKAVKPGKKQAKPARKKKVAVGEKVVSDSEGENGSDKASPERIKDRPDGQEEHSAAAPITTQDYNQASELHETSSKEEPSAAANPPLLEDDDDESELSSLIDEPPARKKRQKKGSASEPKSRANSTTKNTKANKTKGGKELSADEEEIKRLQNWLVKCGIRKMWWKELAPYPTGKEKIRHLKEMLDDAGMTGRYSNEKAKQIKESRELAEELKAVEQFNERWGQGEGDSDNDDDDNNDNVNDSSDNDSKENKDKNENDNSEKDQEKGNPKKEVEPKENHRPKKRLPKGFIDFGDSGDDCSE